MRAILCSLIISTLLAAGPSMSVLAQNDSLSTAKVKPWYFVIGLPMFRHSYEEPGLMEEKGWTGAGLRLVVRYNDTKSLVALEFEGALANITYDGAVQKIEGDAVEIIPVTVTDIEDSFDEVRLVAGKPLKMSPTSFVIPYAGVGARFWSDDLSTWDYGYTRESRYIYSPVGVEVWLQKNIRSPYRLTLEYDFFLRGRQRSYLSDLNTEYNPLFGRTTGQRFEDATNLQTKGYGLRASLEAEMPLQKRGFGVLQAYVRYWNIDASDITSIHYRIEQFQGWGEPSLVEEGYLPGSEPANKTIQVGVAVMLGVRL